MKIFHPPVVSHVLTARSPASQGYPSTSTKSSYPYPTGTSLIARSPSMLQQPPISAYAQPTQPHSAVIPPTSVVSSAFRKTLTHPTVTFNSHPLQQTTLPTFNANSPIVSCSTHSTRRSKLPLSSHPYTAGTSLIARSPPILQQAPPSAQPTQPHSAVIPPTSVVSSAFRSTLTHPTVTFNSHPLQQTTLPTFNANSPIVSCSTHSTRRSKLPLSVSPLRDRPSTTTVASSHLTSSTLPSSSFAPSPSPLRSLAPLSNDLTSHPHPNPPQHKEGRRQGPPSPSTGGSHRSGSSGNQKMSKKVTNINRVSTKVLTQRLPPHGTASATNGILNHSPLSKPPNENKPTAIVTNMPLPKTLSSGGSRTERPKQFSPAKTLKDPKSAVGCVLISNNCTYKLEKLLQTAIYGAVYLATETRRLDSQRKRKVAVKIMLRELERKHRGTLQEDIFAELRFHQAMAGHANVLVYDETWEDAECVYIVMPYAEFEDLFEVLRKRPVPLAEREARWVFSQLCDAAHFLHTRGVAFRDHSLENVLMFLNADDGTVIPKVTDPGQACFIQFDHHNRVKGLVAERLFGKSFRPPEIYSRRPYNPVKVDTFCLGWMLFFAVTKHQAFDRAVDADAHWTLIRRGRFKELLQVRGGSHLSPSLGDLLARMLSPDVSLRPTPRQCLDHKWFKLGRRCPLDDRTIYGEGNQTADTLPTHPNILRKIRRMAEESRMSKVSTHTGGGSSERTDLIEVSTTKGPTNWLSQNRLTLSPTTILGNGTPTVPPTYILNSLPTAGGSGGTNGAVSFQPAPLIYPPFSASLMNQRGNLMVAPGADESYPIFASSGYFPSLACLPHGRGMTASHRTQRRRSTSASPERFVPVVSRSRSASVVLASSSPYTPSHPTSISPIVELSSGTHWCVPRPRSNFVEIQQQPNDAPRRALSDTSVTQPMKLRSDSSFTEDVASHVETEQRRRLHVDSTETAAVSPSHTRKIAAPSCEGRRTLFS